MIALGKILFLVLLALVGYALWRGFQARLRDRTDASARGEQDPGAHQNQQGARGIEDMVRCSRCGVHLPMGEALLTDGRYFCTVDHAKEPRS